MKPKHRIALAIVLGSATGMLLFYFAPNCIADTNTLQIAVIGPMSGKDQEGGQAMLDGVNLYLDQVNRRGGINGKRIEAIAYDDQNQKEMARRRATEIARDSQTLIVIGHYYSSTSLEGGSIFKEYGIPAITSSATAPEVTEKNPWYFRVVPDTNLQGKFAAIYTNEILRQDKVYIVYEQDAYGAALHRSFTRAAHDIGLHIPKVWGVNTETDDVDTLLKKITLDLQEDLNPGALFIALQDHEAAKIVRLIRDESIHIKIIGGDAIGSETFLRKFNEMPLSPRAKNDLTDGIYATTFFIRDIGNFEAQQFNHAFERRFRRQPDDLAATTYDAIGIAVEAIKRAKPRGDLAQRRERIRKQLTMFSTIETAYKGVTGRIYFDKHGNVVKPFPLGVYLQGKLVSAPIQLQPIVNPEAIVDLHSKVEEGKILAIDDQFMHKTNVIYSGIDINEISNIDPRNGTFRADFYLWFRHRGPLDYSKIEFLNASQDIHLDDPIMKMALDDMAYSAYRIKGEFQEEFTFRDYPFDSQILRIRFHHKRLNSNRLLFVSDDIGMQRDIGKRPVESLNAHSTIDPSGKWQLQDVLVFSDFTITDSTLGNPHLFHAAADTNINYSRFNVVIEIARNTKSYILKHLIPLFIIIVLAYVMLFISPQGPPFVARMNVGVTALLSAIFLSMRASNQLPSIGHLVALDYIYFTTYAVILLGIVISVAGLIAFHSKQHIVAKRLDIFGRVVQPLFVLAAIVVFLFLYV